MGSRNTWTAAPIPAAMYGLAARRSAEKLLAILTSDPVPTPRKHRLTYPEGRGLRTYDAILSVGVAARSALPWTVINSNGWLARVSSGPSSLPRKCDLANPVGALAAACCGVSEVFKRLIALRAQRGELLDGISFSLWSYSPTDDPGPPLPAECDKVTCVG